MIYFPFVGLALGLILALLNYSLAPYLPSEILSIVLLTVLVLSTGGIHLEDLRATFDIAPTKIEARQNSSLGFVAIVMVLLFTTFTCAGAESNPTSYTINVHVTSCSQRSGQVRLKVTIDGKKYELQGGGGLPIPGDYKARVVKDAHNNE